MIKKELRTKRIAVRLKEDEHKYLIDLAAKKTGGNLSLLILYLVLKNYKKSKS